MMNFNKSRGCARRSIAGLGRAKPPEGGCILWHSQYQPDKSGFGWHSPLIYRRAGQPLNAVSVFKS